MNSSRRFVSTCIAESSTPNRAISGVTSAKGWCLSRQRWIVGAVIAFLTLCFAQPSAAQATINVNTTQQGVTTGQCSLQEAIYATEFQSSTAIDTTDPDHTYSTGCVAGTGKGDTIVLPAGGIRTPTTSTEQQQRQSSFRISRFSVTGRRWSGWD
jgi:hypothetical protein